MRILLSGAAGRIGYSLIPMMGLGHAFGRTQKLDLVLYDMPEKDNYLKGLKYEIQDSNFDLIKSIKTTTVPEDAFGDVDVIVFLAGIPLPQKTSRFDYLAKNKHIYFNQAEYMNKYSKKDVKALIVANPANTLALILAELSKKIDTKNITSLMRLDQNRAVWIASERFAANTSDITNIVVWGNHSSTQYPCLDYLKIKDRPNFKLSTQDMHWAKNTFLPAVRTRAQEVASLLGYPSVLSPAKAACDHLKNWFFGNDQGTFITMGVISDGSYGVPKGLIFGMPIKCNGNFEYEVIKDLALSKETDENIKLTIEECAKERKIVFP